MIPLEAYIAVIMVVTVLSLFIRLIDILPRWWFVIIAIIIAALFADFYLQLYDLFIKFINHLNQ